MEINGIPLHPLVVHAAVVLDPLAGVLAIVYAFFGKWRWALRWPFVVVTVGGALVTWFAAFTGDSLKHMMIEKDHENPNFIADHEKWAGLLQTGMWGLAAIAVLAWWALPYVTRLAGSADRRARVQALVPILTILLPIAGIAVMVLCFLTGDAGAKSVWAG